MQAVAVPDVWAYGSPAAIGVVGHEVYRSWFEAYRSQLHGRSAFHQPAWLAAAARGLGHPFVCIGRFHGPDLVDVLPGVILRYGPFRLFGSPLRGVLTSHLGPIGLTLETTADVQTFIRECCQFVRQQWGVQYAEFVIRESPSQGWQELEPGWELEPVGSYCLDLSSGEDAIWAAMRTRCRRHIRQSQRLGIRIVPFSDVHTYHQMLDETMARRWRRTRPERYYRPFIEDLVPQDLLWALGAEYQGQVIAAALLLRDEREVHFVSGASFSRHRSIPTSYLLHWHAIQLAIRAGATMFDFAGKGDAGLRSFKQSFSPEGVEYSSLSWASPPVRRALQLYTATRPYTHRFQRLASLVRERGHL